MTNAIADGIGPASSQLPFEPLAVFQSCFPLKNGTPRQGILAPDALGKLTLRPYRGTTPKDVLEGLEQYSHVWVIFWFHGNANKHMRAKVQPPRLNGVSVGCLATRTPHRLIPIGMTAAKLVRIESGDTLVVSGIDLIDGTPILDIKPYVPRYDSIPEAICPDWMIQPTGTTAFYGLPLPEAQFRLLFADITTVIFTDRASQRLEELAPTLRILPSAAAAKQTIEQTLHSDPRSVYRKKKCEREAFGFHVDSLNVQCFIEETTATVYNVEPGDQESDTQPESVGIIRSSTQKE